MLFMLNSCAKESVANNSMQNDAFCKRLFAKFPNSINLSKKFINWFSLEEVENIGYKIFMLRLESFCCRPPNWVGPVWEKYSYRIYKLCLQKCGTKDEADDLFQEVALRFCKKARDLKYGTYLLPWFNTVLLNCHYSDYRKKGANREIPFSFLRESIASYDSRGDDENLVLPKENIRLDAVMAEFSVLLEVLTPLEKMIVELSVLGGLRVIDLSQLFGLSKGCIAKRRMVAFQKMREKMISQNERFKVMMGRNATLREIIEFAR